MADAAFAQNADGSAKDPAAFRAALQADPERVKELQASGNPRLALPMASSCARREGHFCLRGDRLYIHA